MKKKPAKGGGKGKKKATPAKKEKESVESVDETVLPEVKDERKHEVIKEALTLETDKLKLYNSHEKLVF